MNYEYKITFGKGRGRCQFITTMRGISLEEALNAAQHSANKELGICKLVSIVKMRQKCTGS